MTETTPRLLDLTRLVSRSGRTLTGIDRVEMAYAEALFRRPDPVWALVRTSLGFLLLDRGGIGAIVAAAQTGAWGRRDILSRLSRKLDADRQRGQSFARAWAVDRCLARNLSRMCRRHLPEGVSYLNVGHANLGARVLQAMRTLPSARVTIMIHDTIPLDLPDLQREGTVDSFRRKVEAAGRYADLLLAPSEASRRDILRHLGPAAPPVRAAHLGVTPARPDPAGLPAQLDLGRPYFVVLGTIEPRKNHAMLLDLWAESPPGGAQLLVCGGRGWRNEAVLARLDSGIAQVTELGGLDDGAISALLSGARALLFPSLAEGYGLPAIEAAALGTPVICSDLDVFRETLGEVGVYLPPTDRYLWKKTIEEFAGRAGADRIRHFEAPSWDIHFRKVLSHA